MSLVNRNSFRFDNQNQPQINGSSRIRRSEQWGDEEDQRPFLMGLTKAELLSNKRHRAAAAAASGQAFPVYSPGMPSNTFMPPTGNNIVNLMRGNIVVNNGVLSSRMMSLNAGRSLARGGLPIFLPGTPPTYMSSLGSSNMLQQHAVWFPRTNHSLNRNICSSFSLLWGNNSFNAGRPYSSQRLMSPNFTLGPDFGSMNNDRADALLSYANTSDHRGFSHSVRPPNSLIFGQGFCRLGAWFETRPPLQTSDLSASANGTPLLQPLKHSASANGTHLRPLNSSASADDTARLGLGPTASSPVSSTTTTTGIELLSTKDESPVTCEAPATIRKAKPPANNSIPLTLNQLMETGIFEGQRVRYISLIPKVILEATVKDGAYLCSCKKCEETPGQTISDAEFEQHAKCKNEMPTRNIFFPNGKNLPTVMEVLQATPDEKLYEALQNITGSPISPEILAKSKLGKCNILATTSKGAEGKGLMITEAQTEK